MEYRRTAAIKLDTPEGADTALRETVEQFKHCTNTASDWCWHGRRQIPSESGCQPETQRVSGDDDGYHVTSKAKAERALYDRLRDETDLTANLVQKGIRRAVEAVKSGVEASNVVRTRRNRTSRQTVRCTTSGARRSTATTFLFRP